MLRLARWLALALAGLVSSCVTLQQPLGDQPAGLAQADWDGPWVSADGGIGRFTVVSKDVLRISNYTGQDDPSGEGELALRRWQEWYVPQFSATAPYHALSAMLREGNTLFLCRFDSNRIAELVTEGWLPGEVEVDPQTKDLFPANVTLGALTDEHYKILFSLDTGGVVCSRSALFVRLPVELDACIRQALEASAK
jgi:hypothetical protein